MAETIRVEVAYALPGRQWLLPLEVPVGCTVAQAIERSGLAREVPDLVIKDKQVGIFYRPCTLDTVISAGDRVEIYRSLSADPKEVRRRRAAQSTK